MKIALGVEYDGSHYFGWQKQNSVVSVQQKVEEALSIIANHKIEVFCAGRTDTGVHALGQVIHFDTTATRKLHAWVMGTNAHLDSDIAIKWAKEVNDSFHARFSATARRYQYVIYNKAHRTAIMPKNVTHYAKALNEEKMHQAAQHLLGENNFSAFRSSQCQSNSPYRNVHFVNVSRKNHYIVIDIKANAFLHHMVRNIVGSLIEIGNGNQSIDWIKFILNQQNRNLAAATAKPNGLYLIDVNYPEKYQLPQKKHHFLLI